MIMNEEEKPTKTFTVLGEVHLLYYKALEFRRNECSELHDFLRTESNDVIK